MPITRSVARACITVFALGAFLGASHAADAPKPAEKNLLGEVTWAFSGDGGRTFALKSAPAVPSMQTVAVAAQATFTLDRTDTIGALWLGPVGPSPGITRGREGEWSRPLVTEAVVTVNGKEYTAPFTGIVYNRFVLEPADLVKGRNVVTVAGKYCNAFVKGATSEDLTPGFALTTAGPEGVEFQAGPVVGAVGPDWFSVTARTNAPCVVTLKAHSLDPVGPEGVAQSPRGIFHRFRVPMPKGTKSFSYAVTPAAAADKPGKGAGPFTVRAPDFSGKSFRLATAGQTDGGGWTRISAAIQKSGPDIFVHAGGMNCFPLLDGGWDGIMFKQCADLVATVPTYAMRGCEEGGGPSPIFAEMIYSPTPDGRERNFAQSFGDVLLVGLNEDALTDWSAESANLRWLESVLKASREKFILVFSYYPGYGSGQGMRPPLSGVLLQSREVIMPLLVKYHVTAMVSSFGHHYERSEPTGDKGVPCIVTAGAGGPIFKASGRALKNNPFSTFWINRQHYCVFDFKDDACELKAMTAGGEVLDKKTFQARKVSP